MRLGTIDEMSKQPHRKRVKHFHEPGDLHELTFSCYRRLPLLTNDDWRCRLSRSLDRAIQEAAMQLVAFVYMPEHVHLLVYPTGEANVSRLLGRLNSRFRKRSNKSWSSIAVRCWEN